jgi:hypothetical protein
MANHVSTFSPSVPFWMRHFGFWLGAGILNVLLQILRNYVKYVTNKNFHWKKNNAKHLFGIRLY